MKCTACNTINLDEHKSCVNCGSAIIATFDSNYRVTNQLKSKAAQQRLLQCPYCAHQFALTWPRYFKAPAGKYVCTNCNRKAKLERRLKLMFIMFIFSMVINSPFTIYALIYGKYYFIAIGYAVSNIVLIPVDKYFDTNFRQLISIDDDK